MRDVEKMWKSLWVSLGESCGEVLGELWKSKFSTKCGQVFHRMGEVVEKFSWGFTHGLTDVKWRFYTVSTGLTNTTIILG